MNPTVGFRNKSTSKKSVKTNTKSCFHRVNTDQERVVVAVQLAYDEYTIFLEGIRKDLSLGEITKAKSRIVVREGILFIIHFNIDYISAGDKMKCVTIVLENLTKVFDVISVQCDCCVHHDGLYITDLIKK